MWGNNWQESSPSGATSWRQGKFMTHFKVKRHPFSLYWIVISWANSTSRRISVMDGKQWRWRRGRKRQMAQAPNEGASLGWPPFTKQKGETLEVNETRRVETDVTMKEHYWKRRLLFVLVANRQMTCDHNHGKVALTESTLRAILSFFLQGKKRARLKADLSPFLSWVPLDTRWYIHNWITLSLFKKGK